MVELPSPIRVAYWFSTIAVSFVFTAAYAKEQATLHNNVPLWVEQWYKFRHDLAYAQLIMHLGVLTPLRLFPKLRELIQFRAAANRGYFGLLFRTLTYPCFAVLLKICTFALFAVSAITWYIVLLHLSPEKFPLLYRSELVTLMIWGTVAAARMFTTFDWPAYFYIYWPGENWWMRERK